MELLTGKAKEAFENFYTKGLSTWGKVLNLDLFYSKPDIEKLAYYINFFDSVGIYILPIMNAIDKMFAFKIRGKGVSNFTYNSRQEAKIAGIKKASEIFNSKF